MKKNESYLVIALLIAIPIFIYFQFLIVRVYTICGDDLIGFQSLIKAKNLSEVLALSNSVEKFRPVSGLVTKGIYILFQKNLACYYLYNIAIQTINAYLIAVILNLFLKSPLRSLLFGLIYGMTRFSFYSCSQVVYGGGLEALAMVFFLATLYFIIKAIINNDHSKQRALKYLLWSTLFANLAIYTHERYIVVFPFIILITLFFPTLKKLNVSSKILISGIAVFSIFANVAIKKYVYSMPFFVGTGSTNISFSFTSAITFFKDAMLCIFQINSGNLGHNGSIFLELPWYQKIIVFSFTVGLVFILYRYLRNSKSKYAALNQEEKTTFLIFISLPILFLFCLVPAIVTIRLEQRWLQAPFSIFLIMTGIALGSFKFEPVKMKNIAFILFTVYFLGINANYFYRGITMFYINSSQRCAAMFEKGIKNGNINPYSNTLYIWTKHRDLSYDDFVNWSIGAGYFFEYYQEKSKRLVFVDSAYLHAPGAYPGFNKDSAQVITLKGEVVTDLTAQFVKDSLKSVN